MVALEMRFETLDEDAKAAVRRIAKSLPTGAMPGMDAVAVRVVRDFLTVLIESDGVAFGPLARQLSPEQAGVILGISRPLVVRRMDDGRLPFTMVGAHRKCLLKDVLLLKEKEETADDALAELYELHEEIETAPSA